MWQKMIEGESLRAITALKNVKKPLLPNVKSGDNVLILTDVDHDPGVWKLISAAINDLRANPIISVFKTREMDYYDPPQSVAEQMKEVDLIITCTSTAMLHSPAAKSAMEHKVPIIAMDGGLTVDMLSTGAATADYSRVEQIEYEIGEKVFQGGKMAHLTSNLGTDLTISVEDRVFLYRKPDRNTIPLELYEKRPNYKAVVFPRGEFNIPPNPSTADGTLVIDTTMHHIGKLDSPIRIEIETGTIVDISGGYEAAVLENVIEEYGDENAYKMPTEFSVGANPQARVTGCQREDKSILGSIHIGLGTNDDVGGDISSNLHMDGVIASPTLYVDGDLMIDNGDILPLEL